MVGTKIPKASRQKASGRANRESPFCAGGIFRWTEVQLPLLKQGAPTGVHVRVFGLGASDSRRSTVMREVRGKDADQEIGAPREGDGNRKVKRADRDVGGTKGAAKR